MSTWSNSKDSLSTFALRDSSSKNSSMVRTIILKTDEYRDSSVQDYIAFFNVLSYSYLRSGFQTIGPNPKSRLATNRKKTRPRNQVPIPPRRLKHVSSIQCQHLSYDMHLICVHQLHACCTDQSRWSCNNSTWERINTSESCQQLHLQ